MKTGGSVSAKETTMKTPGDKLLECGETKEELKERRQGVVKSAITQQGDQGSTEAVTHFSWRWGFHEMVCPVIMTDEHSTSKTCCSCFAPLELAPTKRVIKGIMKRVRCNGAVICII
ncbi:hypothetical protein B0O80DRAFT_237704 [Mortierella sp. GBAus27b]|nr:hypothetical protein B0O80DRAFT_237704 [Mortierella sp. GBAus27b]